MSKIKLFIIAVLFVCSFQVDAKLVQFEVSECENIALEVVQGITDIQNRIPIESIRIRISQSVILSVGANSLLNFIISDLYLRLKDHPDLHLMNPWHGYVPTYKTCVQSEGLVNLPDES